MVDETKTLDAGAVANALPESARELASQVVELRRWVRQARRVRRARKRAIEAGAPTVNV